MAAAAVIAVTVEAVGKSEPVLGREAAWEDPAVWAKVCVGHVQAESVWAMSRPRSVWAVCGSRSVWAVCRQVCVGCVWAEVCAS